jgi:hypothetical protein
MEVGKTMNLQNQKEHHDQSSSLPLTGGTLLSSHKTLLDGRKGALGFGSATPDYRTTAGTLGDPRAQNKFRVQAPSSRSLSEDLGKEVAGKPEPQRLESEQAAERAAQGGRW